MLTVLLNFYAVMFPLVTGNDMSNLFGGIFCGYCYFSPHPWAGEKDNSLQALIMMQYTQAASEILCVWKVIKKKNLERKYLDFIAPLLCLCFWEEQPTAAFFNAIWGGLNTQIPLLLMGFVHIILNTLNTLPWSFSRPLKKQEQFYVI